MATAQGFFAARRWPAATLDVAIAAVTLAGTLALLHHGGVTPPPASMQLDAVGVLLSACSTVPLLAWRRWPRGVFVVTATAGVIMAALSYPVDLLPGPTAALYLLAASRDRESPWTRLDTAGVAGPLAAFLIATGVANGTFPTIALLHTGLAWSVALFAGESTRLRRERVTELEQRAVRAVQDAERERLLAIAEERARIARDLHDSAGNAISVIAVRAGAARLRHHQDPDRSLLALRAVEELARQTAEEIDRLVGGLRDSSRVDGRGRWAWNSSRVDGRGRWAWNSSPNGTVEPPAGLASLDTLIAHQVAAGLHVTVDSSGTPGPLGSAADQATYRILQEALTNAARHGSGRARVELAFTETAIELTVTNPLRVTPERPARAGGGHGLIGMRERAALVGGRLEAARIDGDFRVRAHIPYGGHRP